MNYLVFVRVNQLRWPSVGMSALNSGKAFMPSQYESKRVGCSGVNIVNIVLNNCIEMGDSYT
jgi:hypothetical protein